jgi:amidase
MSGLPFFIEEITISGVHSAIRAGRITIRGLVEAYLDRIEAYDKKGPAINSIIAINPKALEAAERLDAEFVRSGLVRPLHGIPIVLKDNIETKNMPTSGGSLSLEGYRPDKDADIVRRLRDAGAIILAKVNLHEFALWGETVSSILGQTLNPYDLTRTPGGSSGGTGAAISANFGAAGVGTDTVNSIRSPASACSLIGIKPTMGLVSRKGVIPYSPTQDTVGPLTRSVADAAVMLDVMAGYEAGDPDTAASIGNIPRTYSFSLSAEGLKGARIGVLRSFFGKDIEHEEVNQICIRTIEGMNRRGAEIIDIHEPLDADKILAGISVNFYELKEALGGYLRNAIPPTSVQSLEDIVSSGKHHPGIRENILKALSLSATDDEYHARLARRRNLQQLMLRIMRDNVIDALVFPHQRCLVAEVGKPQSERNGVLAAVTGFPSITVPAGFSRPTENAPIGVPVGIEFVGRPWSEPVLIRLAYAFEQSTRCRRPPILVHVKA